MAITKRVSPNQHYHIHITHTDTCEPTRFGFYRDNQGRDGSNTAAREMAQSKAKSYGDCGESHRLMPGHWTAFRWNKPADADHDGVDWDVLESVRFWSRLCFETECIAANEPASVTARYA